MLERREGFSAQHHAKKKQSILSEQSSQDRTGFGRGVQPVKAIPDNSGVFRSTSGLIAQICETPLATR